MTPDLLRHGVWQDQDHHDLSVLGCLGSSSIPKGFSVLRSWSTEIVFTLGSFLMSDFLGNLEVAKGRPSSGTQWCHRMINWIFTIN